MDESPGDQTSQHLLQAMAVQNFSLHNKVNGHLKLTHQVTVLEEIVYLSTCSPEEIPEECRFLLDFEMIPLDNTPLSQQEYWVSAMTAAKVAGSRRTCPS
jgi:hypothetical protein